MDYIIAPMAWEANTTTRWTELSDHALLMARFEADKKTVFRQMDEWQKWLKGWKAKADRRHLRL